MSALNERAGKEPVTIDIEANAVEPDAAAATALVVGKVYANPVIIYEDAESLEAVMAAIERKVKEFVPDLSTPTTRKKVTSLAYEVSRTKTLLDDAGKEKNASLREEINKVDETRRSMRDRLDTLRDLARQPLTDWEAAEERRKAAVARDLEDLREAGMVFSDDTIADLETRLAKMQGMSITLDYFGTFATEAEGRRTQAITALEAGIERFKVQAQHEAEQAARDAELERARVELAELRAANERQAAAEAARVEAERVRQAEEARIAREKEAAELAAKEAAERAEREAEQRRIDEEEAQERIRQAELAAERRAREEAAAEAERQRIETEQRHAAELKRIEDEAAQRERERLAAIEAERIAREAEEERRQEQERLASEAERLRQANAKHRANIKAEVVGSIIKAVPEMGGTEMLFVEDAAGLYALVDAIAAGKIAHTSIQF